MAKKPTADTDNRFMKLLKPFNREPRYLHKGEILIVFLAGYLIALFLWLLINLGKEYHITLEVPLSITNVSADYTFAERPPEHARISVSGDGWNLFPLYRNPPVITIPYEEGTVSIARLIEEQLGGDPDITLENVEPALITVEREPKRSKRVPISPNLDVRFQRQYEMMGEVRVDPDSVTVTASESFVDTLESWPTELLRLRDVKDAVDRRIALMENNHILSKDTSEVRVMFEVTEFTEGEVRIYVRAVNVPDDRQIRFNPTVINVRYDVPIEYFSDAQEIIPYEARIDYNSIQRDTTGFVEPEVRPTTDELRLRLRSFRPRRVSYFQVIDE